MARTKKDAIKLGKYIDPKRLLELKSKGIDVPPLLFGRL